ncbi:hypothetical protein GcM3_008053, partial [Golovinomyces cichoracearum]
MALELPTEFSQYTTFIIADKLNDFKLNPVKENVQLKILQTYILQRISWYTVNNWVGGQLHEYFRDNFKNWDKTMMDKCQNSVINLLRDFLVKHG